MHQSPARLQNIAATVKYLWHLEKHTGTKNSRGLIPALEVNYSDFGQSIYLAFLWEFSFCDCKTGTTAPTCCPGELGGMTNSSPGTAAAWQSLIPSEQPLEETPGGPALQTVDTRRCSPSVRLLPGSLPAPGIHRVPHAPRD